MEVVLTEADATKKQKYSDSIWFTVLPGSNSSFDLVIRKNQILLVFLICSGLWLLFLWWGLDLHRTGQNLAPCLLLPGYLWCRLRIFSSCCCEPGWGHGGNFGVGEEDGGTLAVARLSSSGPMMGANFSASQKFLSFPLTWCVDSGFRLVIFSFLLSSSRIEWFPIPQDDLFPMKGSPCLAKESASTLSSWS